MKCELCENDTAEVRCSWPSSRGGEEAKVCGSCCSQIWNKLSTDFSGTEAHMAFSIDPVALSADLKHTLKIKLGGC